MMNHFSSSLITVTLLALPSLAAAFDMTSFRALETSTEGRVSTTTQLKDGASTIGVRADYAGSVYVDPQGDKDRAVKDATALSLIFGKAASQVTSFHLGVHVTDEVVPQGARAAHFRGDSGYKANAVKRTQFSGLSFMSKTRLLTRDLLSFNLAGFATTGTLQGNTYSLTRDDKPSLGWMAIGGWGAERSAMLSLNAGYRYRAPVERDDYFYKNELFYRAAADFYVNPLFGMYVSADGRRIMKATRNGPMESGAKKYEPLYGTAYLGGVKYQGDAIELSLYAGRAAKGKEFGMGTKIAGLELNYSLGVASAAPAASDEPATVAAPVKKRKGRGPLGEEKPVNFIDDIQDAEGAAKAKDDLDDFQVVEDSIRKQYDKYPEGQSPDEMAEKEIEVLKRAEEAKRAREAKIRAAEERKQATEYNKTQKKNAKRRQELEKEVKTVIDDYPDVSDEEVNWNGLE